MEGYINIYDISLSIKNMEKIIEQMKNSICIINNNNKNGIGLLCKIKFNSKLLPMLITYNNIIEENENIKIYIGDKEKEINIDNIRNKIIIKELNIILIEIYPNIDDINIKYFIELDNNNIDYINSNIYIINYSNEDNIINISYGLYSNIKDNKINNIKNIDNNFIFSLKNNKLIGIYNKDLKIIKLNNIINKYNEIDNNIKLNGMTIRYKLNNNDKRIKLFGEEFVKNNKERCKMIINNKEKEICEYLDIDKNILEIKLKEIKSIDNMSYMFSGCDSLETLPDISKWNTNNVINMSYMFSECKSLYRLADISK